VALLALALYMFFFGRSAQLAMGWIIAIYLAITGAVSLYVSMQAREQSDALLWTMLQGVIGLAAGVIVMLLLLFQVLVLELGLLVLGLGCLGYAGIGVYMVMNKELAPLRPVSLFGVILFLVVGVLLVLQWMGIGAAATMVQILNLVLAIAGIALIFWAIIQRRERAPSHSPAAYAPNCDGGGKFRIANPMEGKSWTTSSLELSS
jgi:hypothetical protein